MPDAERSDLFDDPEEQIASIQARIAVKTATPERRRELGWWVFGAHKQIWRLRDVARARRDGEHRFVIHEWRGGQTWALCTCGARIPGTMHDDSTPDRFPTLPGHIGD
jgi:hypothetical protein